MHGQSQKCLALIKKVILAEIKVAKVKIPLFRYFVPPPDFFQVRRGPCLDHSARGKERKKDKEREIKKEPYIGKQGEGRLIATCD